MKARWLAATIASAAASIGGSCADPDRQLIRELLAGRDLIEAIRLCWMIPLLGATAALWSSARRGIRPAHAELAAALALGALAYPFVSIRVSGSPSAWIGSFAAAFVMVFAAVLGGRALALARRPEGSRRDPLY